MTQKSIDGGIFDPVHVATISCIVQGVIITIKPNDIAAIVREVDPFSLCSWSASFSENDNDEGVTTEMAVGVPAQDELLTVPISVVVVIVAPPSPVRPPLPSMPLVVPCCCCCCNVDKAAAAALTAAGVVSLYLLAWKLDP